MAGRSYKLRAVQRSAPPGRLVRVKVALGAKPRRALVRGLRKGRKPVLRVGIRARDAAGNRSSLIRLKVGIRR